MPWDLLITSAFYSYIATSWRRESQRPDGIRIAWLIGGFASVGGIVLLLLIALKVSWQIAGFCILSSFAGQFVLMPLLRWMDRSPIGLWAGAIILIILAVYMLVRIL